ncbi:MAG: hypothetical protein M1834_001122 [Cirrosporium novae-zelandiae]|nr:MAG: hypothetical protein M1834_001122 [Cirrosporium novae-zelandiae]
MDVFAVIPDPSGGQDVPLEKRRLLIFGVQSVEEVPLIMPTSPTSPTTPTVSGRGTSELGFPEKLCCFCSIGLPSPDLKDFFLEDFPPHLFQPSQSDVHVIISTLSGTGLAESYFNNILNPLFSSLGLSDYSLHQTESSQSVADLTRSVFFPRACQGISQTIVLLSGDGGLIDLVNVLLLKDLGPSYLKPTVVILPLGTGNAFASSLGLTKSSTNALSTLLGGSPQDVPLFTVRLSPEAKFITDEGRNTQEIHSPEASQDETLEIFGVVVCSWGLHASLVADSDTSHYRKFGAQRFQMAAKELLWPSDGATSHRYKGKITVIRQGQDSYEEVGGDEHMYALTTMVSNLERDFLISPASQPLDGLLRLVHFGPLDSDEVMRIMGLAYQGGKHVEEAVVDYLDVEGVRIDFDEVEDRWRRICIDGKIVVVPEGGWMEIQREEREILNVIAPAS